ncbi:hypothetical protein ACJ73_01925, partial [Blastomyces percursus]
MNAIAWPNSIANQDGVGQGFRSQTVAQAYKHRGKATCHLISGPSLKNMTFPTGICFCGLSTQNSGTPQGSYSPKGPTSLGMLTPHGISGLLLLSITVVETRVRDLKLVRLTPEMPSQKISRVTKPRRSSRCRLKKTLVKKLWEYNIKCGSDVYLVIADHMGDDVM